MLLNDEIDESVIKIFGIEAGTTNTRCSDDADEARGGGAIPQSSSQRVLLSIGKTLNPQITVTGV